ncbi:hypothetical protein, partial [Paenibacillus chitinolyticus]|uniref:hypothetical protein n=1 Tax=Paenibacillus chitinolyticus TaxID=79263 RepID=UPI003670C628
AFILQSSCASAILLSGTSTAFPFFSSGFHATLFLDGLELLFMFALQSFSTANIPNPPGSDRGRQSA